MSAGQNGAIPNGIPNEIRPSIQDEAREESGDADIRSELRVVYMLTGLVVVCAWILGACAFSVAWIVMLLGALFALWTGKLTRLTTNHVKQTRDAEERKKALEFNESVEWLNFIINRWWMFGSRSLFDILKRHMDPLLNNEIKPPFVENAELKNFTFGHYTPYFKGVKMFEPDGDNEEFLVPITWADVVRAPYGFNSKKRHCLVIRANMSLHCPDFHLVVRNQLASKWMGMKLDVAVEKLNIDGAVQLDVQLDREVAFPHVANISVSFLEKPEVWFSVRVLKAVQMMEVPVLKTWIHTIVMEGLTSSLVNPNSLTIDLAPTGPTGFRELNDPATATAKGVLTLTLFGEPKAKAPGLGEDIYYCSVVFGEQKLRTQETTWLHQWQDTCSFLVHDLSSEKLSIKTKIKRLVSNYTDSTYDIKLSEYNLQSEHRAEVVLEKKGTKLDLYGSTKLRLTLEYTPLDSIDIDDLGSQPSALKPGVMSGVLYVCVHNGTDLLAMDRCGTSDPYTIIFCNQKKMKTTHYVCRTRNPTWNYVTEFFIADYSKTNLSFVVLDWDGKYASEDDFLGVAQLPLDEKSVCIVQRELSLGFTEDMVDGPTNMGSITVSVIFRPVSTVSKSERSAGIAKGVNIHNWHRNVQENTKKNLPTFTKQMVQREKSKSPDTAKLRVGRLLSQGTGLLEMQIIQARDLVSRDGNGFSDPYVVVKIRGETKCRTKIKKKTLNPVWNEWVTIQLPNEDESLDIGVWDKDPLFMKDFLGSLHFTQEQLKLLSQSDESWYRLKEIESGEIQLNFKIIGRENTPSPTTLVQNGISESEDLFESATDIMQPSSSSKMEKNGVHHRKPSSTSQNTENHQKQPVDQQHQSSSATQGATTVPNLDAKKKQVLDKKTLTSSEKRKDNHKNNDAAVPIKETINKKSEATVSSAPPAGTKSTELNTSLLANNSMDVETLLESQMLHNLQKRYNNPTTKSSPRKEAPKSINKDTNIPKVLNPLHAQQPSRLDKPIVENSSHSATSDTKGTDVSVDKETRSVKPDKSHVIEDKTTPAKSTQILSRDPEKINATVSTSKLEGNNDMKLPSSKQDSSSVKASEPATALKSEGNNDMQSPSGIASSKEDSLSVKASEYATASSESNNDMQSPSDISEYATASSESNNDMQLGSDITSSKEDSSLVKSSEPTASSTLPSGNNNHVESSITAPDSECNIVAKLENPQENFICNADITSNVTSGDEVVPSVIESSVPTSQIPSDYDDVKHKKDCEKDAEHSSLVKEVDNKLEASTDTSNDEVVSPVIKSLVVDNNSEASTNVALEHDGETKQLKPCDDIVASTSDDIVKPNVEIPSFSSPNVSTARPLEITEETSNKPPIINSDEPRKSPVIETPSVSFAPKNKTIDTITNMSSKDNIDAVKSQSDSSSLETSTQQLEKELSNMNTGEDPKSAQISINNSNDCKLLNNAKSLETQPTISQMFNTISISKKEENNKENVEAEDKDAIESQGTIGDSNLPDDAKRILQHAKQKCKKEINDTAKTSKNHLILLDSPFKQHSNSNQDDISKEQKMDIDKNLFQSELKVDAVTVSPTHNSIGDSLEMELPVVPTSVEQEEHALVVDAEDNQLSPEKSSVTDKYSNDSHINDLPILPEEKPATMKTLLFENILAETIADVKQENTYPEDTESTPDPPSSKTSTRMLGDPSSEVPKDENIALKDDIRLPQPSSEAKLHQLSDLLIVSKNSSDNKSLASVEMKSEETAPSPTKEESDEKKQNSSPTVTITEYPDSLHNESVSLSERRGPPKSLVMQERTFPINELAQEADNSLKYPNPSRKKKLAPSLEKELPTTVLKSPVKRGASPFKMVYSTRQSIPPTSPDRQLSPSVSPATSLQHLSASTGNLDLYSIAPPKPPRILSLGNVSEIQENDSKNVKKDLSKTTTTQPSKTSPENTNVVPKPANDEEKQQKGTSDKLNKSPKSEMRVSFEENGVKIAENVSTKDKDVDTNVISADEENAEPDNPFKKELERLSAESDNPFKKEFDSLINLDTSEGNYKQKIPVTKTTKNIVTKATSPPIKQIPVKLSTVVPLNSIQYMLSPTKKKDAGFFKENDKVIKELKGKLKDEKDPWTEDKDVEDQPPPPPTPSDIPSGSDNQPPVKYTKFQRKISIEEKLKWLSGEKLEEGIVASSNDHVESSLPVDSLQDATTDGESVFASNNTDLDDTDLSYNRSSRAKLQSQDSMDDGKVSVIDRTFRRTNSADILLKSLENFSLNEPPMATSSPKVAPRNPDTLSASERNSAPRRVVEERSDIMRQIADADDEKPKLKRRWSIGSFSFLKRSASEMDMCMRSPDKARVKRSSSALTLNIRKYYEVRGEVIQASGTNVNLGPLYCKVRLDNRTAFERQQKDWEGKVLAKSDYSKACAEPTYSLKFNVDSGAGIHEESSLIFDLKNMRKKHVAAKGYTLRWLFNEGPIVNKWLHLEGNIEVLVQISHSAKLNSGKNKKISRKLSQSHFDP